MFLITPDFTVPVSSILKIFPHRDRSKGTYVDSLNNNGEVDREFTSLDYPSVVGALKGTIRSGI